MQTITTPYGGQEYFSDHYIERVAEFIGGHPVLHFFLLPLYLSSMVTPFRSFLPIP